MNQPRWYDDAHLPTEPGVYYVETCDPYGNPRPGLGLQSTADPFKPTIPTKYYGPIPGAFKPWPMTADQPEIVTL